MNAINSSTYISTTQPTIFVILGITGDLASRKLLPALLMLYTKRMLPQKFAIIGFSRRSFTREEFREHIRGHMHVRPGQFHEEDIKHFLDHISYEQGLFDDEASYVRLAEKLKSIDDRWGQCSNKLFHLSVPPHLYENIIKHLSSSGLTKPCDDAMGWTRILIEKPFGNDTEAATALDKLLGKLFKEEQIFRIDHYLAKEALQNILAFRFANAMFEPLWNNQHIDKIHIKLLEKGTLEHRGAYYDRIGALRDVGQNHMLVMLALMAMDEPKEFTSKSIRKERAKILGHLKPIIGASILKKISRAQYDGYQGEVGVEKDSKTETYVRVEANLETKRWSGVPFFLETGKGFAESRTEIDVYFKYTDQKNKKSDIEEQNILTFRIQPDEGIKVKFFVKTPGYKFQTEAKTLKFKYADASNFTEIPNDYERLIHDAIVGDQTLFASTAEILASWHFITPIVNKWGKLPLKKYERGVREME